MRISGELRQLFLKRDKKPDDRDQENQFTHDTRMWRD